MPNEKGLSYPLKNTGQGLEVSKISFSCLLFWLSAAKNLVPLFRNEWRGDEAMRAWAGLNERLLRCNQGISMQEPCFCLGSADQATVLRDGRTGVLINLHWKHHAWIHFFKQRKKQNGLKWAESFIPASWDQIGEKECMCLTNKWI